MRTVAAVRDIHHVMFDEFAVNQQNQRNTRKVVAAAHIKRVHVADAHAEIYEEDDFRCSMWRLRSDEDRTH